MLLHIHPHGLGEHPSTPFSYQSQGGLTITHYSTPKTPVDPVLTRSTEEGEGSDRRCPT